MRSSRICTSQQAASTGPKGEGDTLVHTDKKLRPAGNLHGVEKEVAGAFRAQRTGRRHKDTRRSRTHAAAADWKVRSVCKKGISKQYKKIKHRCAAEITQHPAILADTYTDCEGTNAKMKIVTVNGRGIKAKVQLMKKMMEAKPDILVWTEHHLPAGGKLPRWAAILLQGYKWGYTSLDAIRGQAGVLMAVHMDLLAGTDLTIPSVPVELHGYIYQMSLCRPASAPLTVTGAYMPTGCGAKMTRQSIYKYVKECMASSANHVHLVAGDMNAALYPTDRETGKKGSHDAQYQTFMQETGLSPFDAKVVSNGWTTRPKTFFRETQQSGENEISRIDDILTQSLWADRPGAMVYTIETSDCNTDHKALCAEVPYVTMGQLPLPVIEDKATQTKTVLVTPLTQEDKQALATAMDVRLSGEVYELWASLTKIMENEVQPYWAKLEAKQITPTDPKWEPTAALQTKVDMLGDRLTDILSKGNQIALQVCKTRQQGLPSKVHHQNRTTARARAKYLRLKHRLRQIRYEETQVQESKDDRTLAQLLREHASDNEQHSQGGEIEDRLKGQSGKALEAHIKEKIKEIDQKDASYVVQRHRERHQRLAQDNQKLGNKIMTGQYKPALRYALRVLKDGNRILTEPNDIIEKCHRSLTDHHAGSLPQPATDTSNNKEDRAQATCYPWEQAAAPDPFSLETEAHDGPCQEGLHHMIMDRAEFDRCLSNISTGKQPGPDGIPNEILKAAPVLLKDCMHMLTMIMWATGCTPHKWKESYTVLLYKNKGNILELDYYRRIGLENTMYKLWTKVVQGVFASYADKHHILSQEQGGFRAHRNTIQQLEIHTMLLEDARLTGQDIFLLLVDLKEAFDTIDHQKMYKILTDLGYPADAVHVVRGLYESAFTTVVTPHGTTAPIKVQRGTLQGDSLSPFLFILYLEPLVRWLSVGAKGYHPGALKRKGQLITFSNNSYADDLTLYTGGHSDLAIQAQKVSQYATWGRLIISQSKTIARGCRSLVQAATPEAL